MAVEILKRFFFLALKAIKVETLEKVFIEIQGSLQIEGEKNITSL